MKIKITTTPDFCQYSSIIFVAEANLTGGPLRRPMLPQRQDYLLIISAAKPYIDLGAELTFLLQYHKNEETHEEFPCYHVMLEFKNGLYANFEHFVQKLEGHFPEGSVFLPI